ncbi:peptidoglycan-binding protein [Nocardia sp. NPDC127526]|uniref:peptidoglycan-binding domain-containing protein n=1 Tax=Nocardia sp. NPDC127526 TaxID=3345393 RepID=UPI00363A5D73
MADRTRRYRGRRLLAACALSVLAAGGAVAGAPAATAATAPSINQCLAFKPLLVQGVQNQAGCVAAVQSFLHAYYRTAVDGKFGPETRDHVKLFQHAKGLRGDDVDGKVGPVTWGLIDRECGVRGDCDYHATY